MPELPIARLAADATPDEVSAYAADELARFLDSEVNPGAPEREEDREVVPRAAFAAATRIGLLNYLLPTDVGGTGGSRRVFGLLLEQMGTLCDDMAFPFMLSMYADIPTVVLAAGQPALVDRYVKPMAAGEVLGTFAFTDYGDAFEFRTRAERKGDRWVVSGVKCLQTGGALADVFVTYARDEHDDIRVLLVDRADAGVSTVPVTTLGIRSGGLTQLALDGVELPAERDLSGPDGLADAQMFLNSRRLFQVCPLVGAMRRMIEVSVRHLDGVIREGRPLTQSPAVQGRLGRMYAQYLTSRVVLHDALERMGRGEVNPVYDPVISAAKYVVTENAVEVGERAIRLTGWRGYTTVLPLERMHRAVIASITGQTAQDILEINLGVIAMARLALADQVERADQSRRTR